MLSLSRGLLSWLLVVGLAAMGAVPAKIDAEDKKAAKKPADNSDDLKDHVDGFSTSDGLSLSGYWFQGVTLQKQRPDAVIMIPAPGKKINDSWVTLARALSKKNFSVLLFDWRGCGLNGPAGVRPGHGFSPIRRNSGTSRITTRS